MTPIIAICNNKGGTGKTTVSANLATTLSDVFKKKILLVDLDPQGSLGDGFGINIYELEKTAFRLMISDDEDIKTYILKQRPNLDLIPNSDEEEMEIRLFSKNQRELRLMQQLEKVRNRYDYIIIDAPPDMNTSTKNAIVAADEVMIVISPGRYALAGISKFMRFVERLKRDFQKNGLKIKVLINNYDKRQNLDRSIREEIVEKLPGAYFETIIGKTVRIGESQYVGQPIFDYDRNSQAHQDFVNLAKEVMQSYERGKHRTISV